MRAGMFDVATDYIGIIVEKCAAVCTGLLLIVVFINVCARYVFQIGITWAEEFSMLLFAWVVFLGAYLALRKKSHLALTFIIKRLPEKFMRANRIFILTATFVLLFVVFIGGIGFVKNAYTLGQKTPLLGISASWAYASIPVSSGLMLLEIVKVFLRKEHILSLENE